MQLAHLHASSRDAPFGGVQIELIPLRCPKLAGPDEHERRELERECCAGMADVAVNSSEQSSDGLGIGECSSIRYHDW